jgi:Tfp pilus assembly protein PilO
MSYSKRNNLTITGILLLLVIIGFFWYRSEAQALDEVHQENALLLQQLQGDLEVSDTFGQFKVERDSLEKKLVRSSKKLINAKEPTFSLSYINWLIENYGINLDFDFYLNEKKNGKRYKTFIYTLNGEGDYPNFCSLIWYITKNPILYNIKNVNLKRSDSNPDLLNFTVMLEGYSVSEAWESGDDLAMVSSRLNWYSEFGHNAFASGYFTRPEPKPVAVKPAKPRIPRPSGLIDVEKASLIAIANDKIYLRSKASGKVVSLKVGGRVDRGRLMRINQSMNQAEFEVKTSIGTRMIYLKLEYN